MTNSKKLAQLTATAEFQAIVNNDKVLIELESRRHDQKIEFFSLMDVLRSTFDIGPVKVQPITPAIWAFLWATGNKYTRKMKEISDVDTDIFLYVLSKGIANLNCTPSDLVSIASGFCPANRIEYHEAKSELLYMVTLALHPLEMIPVACVSSDEPEYDADWLTSLCSIVAMQTGEKASDIMFNMSLGTCYYYYIQYRRQNSKEGHFIRKNTPDEIAKAIYERTMELAEEYARGKEGK